MYVLQLLFVYFLALPSSTSPFNLMQMLFNIIMSLLTYKMIILMSLLGKKRSQAFHVQELYCENTTVLLAISVVTACMCICIQN